MVSYLAKFFIIYIATIFFFITYNYTSGKERSISVTEVLKKVKIFTFYIYVLSISSFLLIFLNKLLLKLFKNFINKTYLDICFIGVFLYLLFKVFQKIFFLFFRDKVFYLDREIGRFFELFYKGYVRVLKLNIQVIIGFSILLLFKGKLAGIKPYVHIFLYLAGGFILYFIYGLLIEKFNLLIEIMFNQWLKIISKIVYIFKLKKETFKVIPYVTFTSIMMFTLLV